MFEAEVHEDRSFVAFAIQQLGVWLISAIWALITVSLPISFGQFGPVMRMAEAGGVVGLAVAPAFLSGRMIQSRHPHFAFPGRWIWVLPTVFVSAFLFVLRFYTQTPLDRSSADLLSPANDLGGVLGLLSITYPTLGCVGYSLGVRVGTRKRVHG